MNALREVILRRFSLCLVALVLIALSFVEAKATIIDLVGDKDGFGLPGAPAVPPDGTLWVDDLGGILYYPNLFDGSDSWPTDVWFSGFGVFNYVHTYSLGGLTPTSATLDIQIAGIHDINQDIPYYLMIGYDIIGTIPANYNENAFQEVIRYSFNIPIEYISGTFGFVISASDTWGDAYIINFSELRIETAPVPEPSTMLLLGSGLVGLLGLGSRRLRK
jgi:hypothetical protein